MENESKSKNNLKGNSCVGIVRMSIEDSHDVITEEEFFHEGNDLYSNSTLNFNLITGPAKFKACKICKKEKTSDIFYGSG